MATKFRHKYITILYKMSISCLHKQQSFQGRQIQIHYPNFNRAKEGAMATNNLGKLSQTAINWVLPSVLCKLPTKFLFSDYVFWGSLNSIMPSDVATPYGPFNINQILET